MGNRYLDTKKDSLESSILGLWQSAAVEEDNRHEGRTKQYKEHRAKLESARKSREEKLSAKQKQLDVDGDGEIEGSDLAKLRKKGEKKDKKEGAMKRGKDLDTFKPKPKKEEVKEDKKYEHGIGKVNSAFEVGTPEYRQHTQSITPGQDITDYQRFKVQSMKEALAKVWGLDEAKKEEKDLTKEAKGGKTMTGKKANEIDVTPEIKEK